MPGVVAECVDAQLKRCEVCVDNAEVSQSGGSGCEPLFDDLELEDECEEMRQEDARGYTLYCYSVLREEVLDCFRVMDPSDYCGMKAGSSRSRSTLSPLSPFLTSPSCNDVLMKCLSGADSEPEPDYGSHEPVVRPRYDDDDDSDWFGDCCESMAALDCGDTDGDSGSCSDDDSSSSSSSSDCGDTGGSDGGCGGDDGSDEGDTCGSCEGDDLSARNPYGTTRSQFLFFLVPILGLIPRTLRRRR